MRINLFSFRKIFVRIFPEEILCSNMFFTNPNTNIEKNQYIMYNRYNITKQTFSEESIVRRKRKLRSLSTSFRLKLLRVTAVFFAISLIIILVSVLLFLRHSTHNLLQKQNTQIINETKSTIKSFALYSAAYAAEMINEQSMSYEVLQNLSENMDSSSVSIVNQSGVVEYSSNENLIGYDLHSNEESSKFLSLFDGKETDYYQPVEDRSSPQWSDGTVAYAGCLSYSGDMILIGFSEEYYTSTIESSVVRDLTRYNPVGEKGFSIIADVNGNIVSAPTELSDIKKTDRLGLTVDLNTVESGKIIRQKINDKSYYTMFDHTGSYLVISAVPVSEIFDSWFFIIGLVTGLTLILLIAVFVRINYLTKRLIIRNIQKINDGLEQISYGRLDTVINVRDNLEFSLLSDGINVTVNTLKGYIDKEARRIDSELAFARSIQESAMPREFPPFPERNEFDLFAIMEPAKTIGGDFYDFFLLDERRLAFLIADVSGKGIPAAMFMMKAKAIVKSVAQTQKEACDVLTLANNILSENNEENMFVTLWLGILDIGTGYVSFANAGHCAPVIKRADGKCDFLRFRSGLMLGAMPGIRYKKREMKIEPGDAIFLYTDGITEAERSVNVFYGEERLLDVLRSCESNTASGICDEVKGDVVRFVYSAPQSDDLTMLALVYKGKNSSK